MPRIHLAPVESVDSVRIAGVKQRVAASLALPALLVLTVAAGCGGHDAEAKPVAFVAGRVITKGQLDSAVEHVQEEAKRERSGGEGERHASRETRNRLIVLLVYWAQLDVGAARLDIHVTDEQVDARLQ